MINAERLKMLAHLQVEPPAPGPGAARSCKALFRRASGKVELGEQGDGALNDLRLAVALSPKPDSAVLALLARAAGDLARQKTLEGAWDEAQNLFKESGQASPPAPPRKRAARRDVAANTRTRRLSRPAMRVVSGFADDAFREMLANNPSMGSCNVVKVVV